MKALTWQGRRKVSVETVPDPTIEQPNDVIIEVTSTAICGSDLHLYEVLGPFLSKGDVLGHETMGVVVETGAEAGDLAVGDRVVVPFNISCGSCWMCTRGLFAQCETTQNTATGKGASLFGYTSLYGSVPGGQAELLRVPQAQFGPIKVPEGVPDERYLYLSDILPTAWQAVEFADVSEGDTVAVFGLGPVGQLSARIAIQRGCRVIGVDPVEERRELAASYGAEVLSPDAVESIEEAVISLTGDRGADATVDAVGMEAHGSPLAKAAIGVVGLLPDGLAGPLSDRAAIDRTAALVSAIKSVRRGGTVSVSGVYGGELDALPMMEMFDRGITMRMGQCHVRRWTDDIQKVLDQDEDVLGVESLATHRLPLESAPDAYEMFQKKEDGCVKVVLKP
jgi:threonine dehydrogenase-like Zn-dependent dehydrogenase